MKKRSIAKATLCCGAALAIVATTKMPIATSATLCGEKGLAGISITLDKYCAEEDIAQIVDESSVPSNNVVATSAAVEETTQFDDLGISTANNYVNIRKKANEESKVIGKLYKGAAATVIEETDGNWVKIESGSCKGYINKEFLATGLRAEELADEYGEKVATVTATTLKVREKADADAACLTMVPGGQTYKVVKETDEWVKIKVDEEEVKGYVSKEYVDLDVEFEQAISIKEEKEKLRKEEEERKAAEEAARQEEEERRAAEAAQAAQAAQAASSSTSTRSTSASNSSHKTSTSSSNKSSSSHKTTTSSSSSSSSASKSSSSSSSNTQSGGSTVKGNGSGAQVASYALQFVGNPYVWGGTSLTHGADCSGFVMSVYAHYGVSLPHSSSAQSAYGKSVSVSQAQAGDLVFYGNGGISHVGICIGGGRIVHAKGKDYGITTDSIGYSRKKIICVKRILG